MEASAPAGINDVLPAEQLARVESLGALLVNSPESESLAIDGLAFLQTVRNGLESGRTSLVKPMNDRVRLINESFKKLSKPVEAAEQKVKTALLSWREAERRRIAAEQERVARENREREQRAREEEERQRKEREAAVLEEARQTGFSEAEAQALAKMEAADVQASAALQEVAPAPPPSTVKAQAGIITARMVWCFEVQDKTAVPEAYKVVDDSAIRKDIGAGVRDIPGVRIFQQEQLAGGRIR